MCLKCKNELSWVPWVIKAKPATANGQYFHDVSVSKTMSSSVKVSPY